MRNKSIIFLLVFLLASCHQQKNQVNKIISTQDSQGILLDLPFYKNKWLIFNYWASWCAPCLKEIPVINHFYHQFNKQGIRVVGIDLDPMDAGQMNKIKQTLHHTTDPYFTCDAWHVSYLEFVSISKAENVLMPLLL